MSLVSGIKECLRELSADERRSVLFVVVSIILLLFSYSLVRTGIDALLLSSLGAKSMPYAWIYSVITLAITITTFNWFQPRVGIQRLFMVSALICITMMITFSFALGHGVNIFLYPMYVLKEVYIVILLSACVGYLNVMVSKKFARTFYGIVGGVASIGGVVGGLLASKYVRLIGIDWLFYIGAGVMAVAIVLFSLTDKSKNLNRIAGDINFKRPLNSVKSVKGYALSIVLIVMFSQFVIVIINQKLNILLSAEVNDSISQAELFGKIYAAINGLSVVLDFFVVPFLFRFFEATTVHFAIPIVNLVFVLALPWMLDGMLPYAILFVVLKGVGYSVFSVGKELLYFSLDSRQKYGVKYIADTFTGRFSKGIISLILIFVYNAGTMAALAVFCLLVWVLAARMLSRTQPGASIR